MFQLLSSWSRKQKAVVFLAIDLALVPLALLFSCFVQFMPTMPLATFVSLFPILPYLLVLVAAVSSLMGLPSVQLRMYERTAAGRTAVLAILAGLTSAGLVWLAGIRLPYGTHVMFAVSYFIMILATRLVLFHIVSWLYLRAQPRRRVLIYGAGATGTQLAQALAAHETIRPVAFVDDNMSLQGQTLIGLPVYTPVRTAELLEKYNIDRVLLAMPSQSQPKQARIVTRLQKLGVEVQALPSFAQLIGEEELVDKLTPVVPSHFLGREAHAVELNEVCSSYAQRTVLVSGAGGSIGSELCRQILACRPKKLVLYELSELALYTIYQELGQLTEAMDIELVPVLGSVTDPRQVRQVLSDHQVQVVLHAAAYKHVPLVEVNPLSGLTNNVLGTQILAREAAKAEVERFLLVSSDKAVRPTNIMGASKRFAELVVQDLAARQGKTIFSIVRFGNVLGSSGSVVPLFQEQVSRGGPVTVTDPRVKRYFMTVREAVQLVLRAGADASGGEVFVLDMGPAVPIMQLARQVIQSAGYTVRDELTPEGDIEIQIIGLRPGEKIEEELSLNNTMIRTDHPKILRVDEQSLSELEMARVMRELRHALAAGNAAAARGIVQNWIEGYVDWEIAQQKLPS
ncbi:polysaccharide biosynthesis protein [Falsiruegeria mediterranea]|uniref:polysaccharide biosynthesis protein n=1 Tax=Falsiruegeria mediterranea TaxID=1280832 RepID=UPI0015F28933|nr:nucleoside-diphosphate sugar epimerase/dehydratase [Falsiruegeria mediterranea]